jgi:hypothetical protein
MNLGSTELASTKGLYRSGVQPGRGFGFTNWVSSWIVFRDLQITILTSREDVPSCPQSDSDRRIRASAPVSDNRPLHAIIDDAQRRLLYDRAVIQEHQVD